jgi:hypothetical protein
VPRRRRRSRSELDAGILDRAADDPRRPDGGEQRDPRDGRREHERQLDQRDDERAAAEAAGGQQVRGRRPDHHDDRERRDAGPQAQPQGVERAGLTERVDQLAGRAVEEDRQHRQHQERQRERQWQREPPHPGGGPNPSSRSASAHGPSKSPSR